MKLQGAIGDETVRDVNIAAGNFLLQGMLGVPANAAGVVLFAHGSGSGRFSPRNQFVAERLRAAGLATLLVDLLTEAEEQIDDDTGALRFDIPFLAARLMGVTDWLGRQPLTRMLPVGLFGASTGGGAALVAAARDPKRFRAVVSRGGRPDLAGSSLRAAVCPTLLIVGGNDPSVVQLNRVALDHLAAARKELVIVPGAGHLFEEPGALEHVAELAATWFHRYLPAEACFENAANDA